MATRYGKIRWTIFQLNWLSKKELVKTLNETLTAKKNGAKCMICGAPIWAAGSAITGNNLCFTCTTGEANDSDDYEIE